MPARTTDPGPVTRPTPSWPFAGPPELPAPGPGHEDPERRRNHRLGVLNGALFQAGDGFIDASTVIPVIISALCSAALIGYRAASRLPDPAGIAARGVPTEALVGPAGRADLGGGGR